MWGANSFASHMAARQAAPVATTDIPKVYQELANATTQVNAGSSAGGEQPKFTCETEARGHLIVKFARVGTRSSELLILEELALRALDAARVDAAQARHVEIDGFSFLEVERFDRVGRFGRRGLISAGAIDDELFGMRDNWPSFAQRCEEVGLLGPSSVRQVLVLTAFSELIGNGDRHFENLSLMTDEGGRPLEVSPAYDMLPMMYAPVGGGIEPVLRLVAPSFQSLGARPDVWEQAFQAADAFWTTAAADRRLSVAMRQISAANARHVAEVVAPCPVLRRDGPDVRVDALHGFDQSRRHALDHRFARQQVGRAPAAHGIALAARSAQREAQGMDVRMPFTERTAIAKSRVFVHAGHHARSSAGQFSPLASLIWSSSSRCSAGGSAAR